MIRIEVQYELSEFMASQVDFVAQLVLRPNHCLGRLVNTDGKVWHPNLRTKFATPVAKTTKTFGPGHSSFVKSPDGTEDWIFYPATERSGDG